MYSRLTYNEGCDFNVSNSRIPCVLSIRNKYHYVQWGFSGKCIFHYQESAYRIVASQPNPELPWSWRRRSSTNMINIASSVPTMRLLKSPGYFATETGAALCQSAQPNAGVQDPSVGPTAGPTPPSSIPCLLACSNET